MIHHYKTATVFGGTGFVGRNIVRELARQGYRIKVATRLPERAYFLRVCGTVGQVVPYPCDYNDPASIADAVHGSDVVINCIGILFERGTRSTFQKAHVDVPAMIAAACAREQVLSLAHISALGIEKNNSAYARTKQEGEMAVLNNFPNASILRPSVMFGEDDAFFNKFARLAQILPALPLIGGGMTKFQPVYVGDVAVAAVKALSLSGRIYELAGPDVVTFRDIYKILFSHLRQKRWLVSLPFGVAFVQARILGLFPHPLLTRDQVESLKSDSVADGEEAGFHDLGMHPESMEAILPSYLKLYRKGGRFA